ncbi:MAG: pyridoxal phosphate-dependent aminotransferase family protein [Candidatus Hydrothermales bacterium]
MDIFEKCRNLTPTNPLYEAKLAIEKGIYPFFIPLENNEGTEAIFNGRRVLMFGSNNYLGLTTDKRVREAAIEAIKKYGTSVTGSRFMNGTLKLHLELEERLAEFIGKEKCIVFSTGYQTNVGTISALLGKEDYAIVDKEDHASIIDGCKMSFGKMERFKHNDVEDLERTIQKLPEDKGKLVIVDGVYSMSGEIAPLPDIIKICKKYNARLMVDDAHSVGVLGECGRGTANHFKVEKDVDLIMGTFSKSFASLGGFIAGDKDVIFYIQHVARSFIFSAAISPPNLASALKALEIMQKEPERIENLRKVSEKWRNGLKSLGFDVGKSQTPIVPVYLRDKWKTVYMWKELLEEGIYVNPVVPPGVPPSDSLLRTSCMATHTDEHIERGLEIFERVGKRLKII